MFANVFFEGFLSAAPAISQGLINLPMDIFSQGVQAPEIKNHLPWQGVKFYLKPGGLFASGM